MMERSGLRFARTSDGVSIAYGSIGSGADAVVQIINAPFNEVAGFIEFISDPQIKSIYARIYGGRRIVVYDPRGCGSSDKDVSDVSLAAYVRDFDAVVLAAGIDRYVVEVMGATGPIGLAVAAEEPVGLKGLILHDAWASGDYFIGPIERKGLLALADADTDTFAEVLVRMASGWRDVGDVNSLVELVKAGASDKLSLLSAVQALAALDATGLLQSIAVPVIVGWERHGNTFVTGEGMRDIAAALPNGTLLATDADADGNPNDEWIAQIGAFVEAALPREPTSAAVSAPRSLQVVLFTDLVGHTEMMQRLGDAKGREVLREHERLTRAALAEHGGSEVKTMGDGFMASFGSAQQALECAIALQRAISAPHSRMAGEGLGVRVGVNAGEPIAEDGDLFGSSVIAAARIAAKAEGGQVLVADVVRQLVAGKGFLFADTGEHILRGMEEPVRVWELRWEGAV